jgi:peroxiredoxin
MVRSGTELVWRVSKRSGSGIGEDRFMQQSFRLIVTVGIVLTAGALAGHAQSISDSQRGEFGKIVREYLIANPEVVQDALKELEKRKALAAPVNDGQRPGVLPNVQAQAAPAMSAGCPCMEMMSGGMAGMNMPGVAAPPGTAGSTMGGMNGGGGGPGGDKTLLAGAEELFRTNSLLMSNQSPPKVAGAASLGASSNNLEKWTGQEPDLFTLQNLSLADIALSAYRGKPVILHFFATWCGPCREEMESLRRFVSRTNSADLTVLAVSVGEPDDRVRRFFDTMPVNFTVLLDRDMAVARAWRIAMLPTTYVLNTELKPKLFLRGEQQWDQLDAAQIVRKLDEVNR